MNDNRFSDDVTIPPDDEPQSFGGKTMPVAPVVGALGRIDQYELVRKLGGGGYGVVYMARDTVSGVEVALKTLHPLLKTNAEEMERIKENFAVVQRLHHPNIAAALVLHPARVVAYADDAVRRELRVESGDPVLVMSYAPGVPLSKWRRQFREGRVPSDKALSLCRQIASALDFAHSERIVHRDVKPSNIMVETREDGTFRARILDFGLAAEIRSSMSRVSREAGDTSGTRPYMAPEQWTGRRQDGRTDQYALAAMYYELVSGEVPFAGVFETGDPVIMMTAVKTEAPESLAELTVATNLALARALAKAPADRFESCTGFVEALGMGDGCESSASSGDGSPEAWVRLANQYFKGQGVEQDSVEAVKWYRKAAEQGNVLAQRKLGFLYFNGIGVEKDFGEALRWTHKAAEQGNAGAQANLGVFYEFGHGVMQNYEEAVKWYCKAAEQGDALAQYNLGSCYYIGQGVDEDYEEAVKWYRKAAEQGNADAQNNLGICYENGHGVMQNNEEAVKWYRKAAEQGNADAQYNLGSCYYNGQGVDEDDEEAVKWFRQAAMLGDSNAQYVLGSFYEKGVGVEQDSEEAVKWYRMAAEHGYVGADPDLNLVLISVVAGSFQMGSENGRDDEKPVRTVRITRDFWMGQTEVTQAQYRLVTGMSPSSFTGDNLPVETVSWDEAVAFCEELTKRERPSGRLPSGYEYRLPTEAEWEYAAKGGIASMGYIYSGGDAIDAVAWYEDNSGSTTLSVGQKAANELGLHDMSGNVWEWCSDWYQDSYSGLEHTDPRGPKTGILRVFRGGSYEFDNAECRVASRFFCPPEGKNGGLGFRVVLAPVP